VCRKGRRRQKENTVVAGGTSPKRKTRQHHVLLHHTQEVQVEHPAIRHSPNTEHHSAPRPTLTPIISQVSPEYRRRKTYRRRHFGRRLQTSRPSDNVSTVAWHTEPPPPPPPHSLLFSSPPPLPPPPTGKEQRHGRRTISPLSISSS